MKLIAIVLIGLIVLSGCLEKKSIQWEYMTVDTIEGAIDINKYGFEGWELISIVTIQTESNRQDYKFYFKRHLQEKT